MLYTCESFHDRVINIEKIKKKIEQNDVYYNWLLIETYKIYHKLYIWFS